MYYSDLWPKYYIAKKAVVTLLVPIQPAAIIHIPARQRDGFNIYSPLYSPANSHPANQISENNYCQKRKFLKHKSTLADALKCDLICSMHTNYLMSFFTS